MKAVWKFPFGFQDTVKINLPVFAEILHVADQAGVPTMWCLVDDKYKLANGVLPVEEKTFYIRGTGHEVEENLQYHSTWFDREFVWHLFENKG